MSGVSGVVRHRCQQMGCGIRIALARTQSGRAMPIDEKPNPAGNLAVWFDEDDEVLRCRWVTSRDIIAAHELRAMPHWSTCRNPPRRNQ